MAKVSNQDLPGQALHFLADDILLGKQFGGVARISLLCRKRGQFFGAEVFCIGLCQVGIPLWLNLISQAVQLGRQLLFRLDRPQLCNDEVIGLGSLGRRKRDCFQTATAKMLALYEIEGCGLRRLAYRHRHGANEYGEQYGKFGQKFHRMPPVSILDSFSVQSYLNDCQFGRSE